ANERPPTPRLRRGLAVSLRAKADASEPTRPVSAPCDQLVLRRGGGAKEAASERLAREACRGVRRAKPLGSDLVQEGIRHEKPDTAVPGPDGPDGVGADRSAGTETHRQDPGSGCAAGHDAR